MLLPCHPSALPLSLQACEADDKYRNADSYSARAKEAERAAKAAKAARDKKPDKRRDEEGGPGGEEDAGPTFDEDAVLPEFSLAGEQPLPLWGV